MNLTGRYQNGEKVVNLRAVLSRIEKVSYSGPPSILPPIGSADSASTSEGYAPDAEYYSNDSEMTKSDGTVLVEAVYYYEDPTAQSMLYLTIGGVRLTFNLATEEAEQISEADQERLNAWAASGDAGLVQEASLAIVNQSEDLDFETMLNYYAIAVFVDDQQSTAAGPRRTRNTALHHAVKKLISAPRTDSRRKAAIM